MSSLCWIDAKERTDNAAYDPNECLDACKRKYPNATAGQIIVAVHQDRCGCELSDMTTFRERLGLVFSAILEIPRAFCGELQAKTRI